MASSCPSEPSLSTTGSRLRPDARASTAVSRRADVPRAGLDRLVVIRTGPRALVKPSSLFAIAPKGVALAYNLANFLRSLALPDEVDHVVVIHLPPPSRSNYRCRRRPTGVLVAIESPSKVTGAIAVALRLSSPTPPSNVFDATLKTKSSEAALPSAKAVSSSLPVPPSSVLAASAGPLSKASAVAVAGMWSSPAPPSSLCDAAAAPSPASTMSVAVPSQNIVAVAEALRSEKATAGPRAGVYVEFRAGLLAGHTGTNEVDSVGLRQRYADRQGGAAEANKRTPIACPRPRRQVQVGRSSIG